MSAAPPADPRACSGISRVYLGYISGISRLQIRARARRVVEHQPQEVAAEPAAERVAVEQREASDAPARRPRAVSDDEKKRPATPPEKTPPAPSTATVSPAAPPNRKRGRQWAGLDESDDDDDDDDDRAAPGTRFLHTTYINAFMACQSSRRRQVIAAAAATDALSTCIGSNSLCCGSTMSRHLGDTSCSIHTHNLHSSWDKVCTSTGVFLYSMNESTLLTKAVSALVFRRFTTATSF